mgnify:FL=1
MRLAVLFENIYLAETGSSIRKALLFEVDDDLITALDQDIVSVSDMDYLCLWLLGKGVVSVYCDGLDEGQKAFLEKTGIAVYPLDAIREHPVIQALLIKEK